MYVMLRDRARCGEDPEPGISPPPEDLEPPPRLPEPPRRAFPEPPGAQSPSSP